MPRSNVAPPRLAERLLEWRLPDSDREFILGDLAEGFETRCKRYNPAAAHRWYWQQAASLFVAAFPRHSPLPYRKEPAMHSFVWDLQQAVRGLLRARAHTALAVLTLAIGIGSAAALFSIVYPVLVQAPPYPQPDRLAFISERDRDGSASNVGFPTITDIGRDARSIASWAALSYWQPNVQFNDRAEPVNGQRVSASYFSMLGVRPVLGRDFTRDDDTPATRSIVMLSHRLWQRAFGGDTAIVGRTVLISGRSFEVAGVLPPSFENMTSPQAEIWAPLGYDASLPYACRTCRHLRMLVRLRGDATREGARAEIEQLMEGMRRTFPDQYGSTGVVVEGLRERMVGTLRPVMLVLGGAVLLLLLIACANVANLVLGRAFERHGEFSLRSALGAGTSRLVRQVTSETMLLALAGSAAGLGVAVLIMRLVPPALTASMPRTAVAQLDLAVVLFACAAAVLTTVVAGVVPALVALRGNMAGALREAGRGVMSRSRHRVRSTLVVVEVSLAIVLLTGSGLLIRTMQHLLAVNTGFNANGVVTMNLSVGGPRYADEAPIRAYMRAAMDAARGVPGVTDVAVTSQLPLGGNFDGWGIHRVDRPSVNPELDPSGQRFSVSPGYLQTMGIAVAAGRGFTEADREGAPPVALINRALASLAYSGEDPLGKQIRVGGNDGEPHTIVGVVEDVRHLSLDAVPEPQFYVPFDQRWADGAMTLVARSAIDPRRLLDALEPAVRAVDPSVAISAQATMREVVNRSAAQRQFALTVLGAFAFIALGLSAAGMYGVISASVAERKREIGVRSALGATRSRIVRMIVTQAALVSALGLVIGVSGAVATGMALRSMLYGVAPWDLTTILGVLLSLTLVVLTACAVPAWRAARVDPAVVLRE
jgi:putative ABC transport system permease protein